MVGASPAVVETRDAVEKPFSTDHTDLADLMGSYPAHTFASPEDRVAWLLDAARELDRLGWTADATEARERALVIVRAVIGKVAGSDR